MTTGNAKENIRTMHKKQGTQHHYTLQDLTYTTRFIKKYAIHKKRYSTTILIKARRAKIRARQA